MMSTSGGERLRIERLRVRNYRVLRHVTLDKLEPLTVLLGPNGSGKSTLFDVFAFLHESFTTGLRQAWDRRGRAGELRSRGTQGPVSFELKYRTGATGRLATYQLQVGERDGQPIVEQEMLRWTIAPGAGRPKDILVFEQGTGRVWDERSGQMVTEQLAGPEVLAVNTLGQLARYPQVAGLRRFISGWYLSYISADQARGLPLAGPQERLTAAGDNLPNVVQYLKERHPERLREIFNQLRSRVPAIEDVRTQLMPDGRLLLQIKDSAFDQPTLARFASDGTLKLLAYLTVLHDPAPPPVIGIEEPENQLHPRLLRGLTEACREAASHSQVLVTTHSPYFVDALTPRELWVLYRERDGFARAVRASDLAHVTDLVDTGGLLGDLWMEGYFGVGDPLTRSGLPAESSAS